MTKNMKYRHALRAYELGCEQVAEAFVSQYFPGYEWELDAGSGITLILVDGYKFSVADAATMIDLLPSFQVIQDYWVAFLKGETPSLREFLQLKRSK